MYMYMYMCMYMCEFILFVFVAVYAAGLRGQGSPERSLFHTHLLQIIGNDCIVGSQVIESWQLEELELASGEINESRRVNDSKARASFWRVLVNVL